MATRKIAAGFFGVIAAAGLVCIASFPILGVSYILVGIFLFLIGCPTAAALWDERGKIVYCLPMYQIVVGTWFLLVGKPWLRAIGALTLVLMPLTAMHLATRK